MNYKIQVNEDIASPSVRLLALSVGDYGLPDSSKVLNYGPIVTAQIPGEDMIIKRYSQKVQGGLLQRLFRRSVGRTAFETALELRRRGVPTPEPLYYVENRSFGVLTRSYYACRNYEGATLDKAPAEAGDKAFGAALEAFRRKLEKEGAEVPEESIIFSRNDRGDYEFTVVNLENCRITN